MQCTTDRALAPTHGCGGACIVAQSTCNLILVAFGPWARHRHVRHRRGWTRCLWGLVCFVVLWSGWRVAGRWTGVSNKGPCSVVGCTTAARCAGLGGHLARNRHAAELPGARLTRLDARGGPLIADTAAGCRLGRSLLRQSCQSSWGRAQASAGEQLVSARQQRQVVVHPGWCKGERQALNVPAQILPHCL